MSGFDRERHTAGTPLGRVAMFGGGPTAMLRGEPGACVERGRQDEDADDILRRRGAERAGTVLTHTLLLPLAALAQVEMNVPWPLYRQPFDTVAVETAASRATSVMVGEFVATLNRFNHTQQRLPMTAPWRIPQDRASCRTRTGTSY